MWKKEHLYYSETPLQRTRLLSNTRLNELFLSQIDHFSTQLNLVIMNPGLKKQKWSVPSCFGRV
jgi:hypothetical protein